MNNNYNNNNSNNQKKLDSQMFINCAFDIDYLEVTKIEPLRKYEENNYLLSQLFSSNIESNNKLNFNNNYTHIEDKDSYKLNSIKKDINDLIKSEDKDINKKKLLSIIDNLKSTNLNNSENALVNQVLKSIEEYDKTIEIINEHKKSVENKRNNYNNIISKLKNQKLNENSLEEAFKEVFNQDYGNEYIKQLYTNDFNKLKDNKINVEENIDNKNLKTVDYPFNDNSSVILTSL